LASVTALKDAQANAALKDTRANPAPQLVFQLLIVPLVDNAATEDNQLRTTNHGAPGPTIERLLSYQRLYLPTLEDGQNWQASPIRLSLATLRGWPVARAYIAVAEVDLLFQEGLEFGRLLGRAGVAVTVHTVEGAPHMIANLGGVMKKGRELLHQAISYMAEQFGEPSRGSATIDVAHCYKPITFEAGAVSQNTYPRSAV
jgi:acetyl esterase/lipase